MPEEQAFCVLVKLMYDYGLRDLYKDRFDNLHMRFYQLQRLIEVCFLIFFSVEFYKELVFLARIYLPVLLCIFRINCRN